MIREQHPNIILILVDDMGYGDFSRFNGGQSSTPALDAFIDQGLCFTQHYAASPVCAPARAALLTGRYPHRTGVVDTLEARGTERLALRETTMADVLGSQGYHTGLVGKWHCGAIGDRYHPGRRGFDEFTGFRGGWQDYWNWHLESAGRTLKSDGRYLTHVVTEEAVDFVRRHRHGRFFLHVAYNAPHFPFQAPPETVDRFRQDDRTEAVATIYAMIAEMDAGVGTILDELERLGIADDTLVLFSSDNGPQLDGTGDASTVRYNLDLAGQKQFVLDGGIRLPLIARWPNRIGSGTENSAFVHSTDLLPTIMDLTGGTGVTTLPLDGISQAGALLGQGPASEVERFWQWTRYQPVAGSNAAVRSGDWKLVYPAIEATMDMADRDRDIDEAIKRHPESFTQVDNTGLPDYEHIQPSTPMLFNIADDPGERHDLARDHPQVVTQLSGKLADWFESVEAERRSLTE